MKRKVPYRCFPRDIGGSGEVCVPKKYVHGLSDDVARERANEIVRRREKGVKTAKPLPGDDLPTKKSSWVKLYKETYGKDSGGSVEKISEDTGIDYDILDEVYARGVGASRTSGHRPGATDYSWALARVYAFVMKAMHGYAPLNHDQDIAREAGLLDDREENPASREIHPLLLVGGVAALVFARRNGRRQSVRTVEDA